MSQIGWRAWMTDSTGALVSFTKDVWPPDEPLEAECNMGYAQPMRGFHPNVAGTTLHGPCPSVDCSCGIYVFKWAEDVEGLIHSPWYSKSAVIGCVEWWGRAWEHELGWRVQFAQPRGLYQVRGKRLHSLYSHLVDRRLTWEQLVERWETPDGDG